ncbi:MAG: hypothetical protein IJ566_04235 [Cardiobacteriaceae bacterium]|nr:hypothetical protein [Cardiobacteriaceae bacterium]
MLNKFNPAAITLAISMAVAAAQLVFAGDGDSNNNLNLNSDDQQVDDSNSSSGNSGKCENQDPDSATVSDCEKPDTGISNSAAQNEEKSPFSVIPAYLDVEQSASISYPTVRPRVMLLIDNSGSMSFYPDGTNYEEGSPEDCRAWSYGSARAGDPACAPTRIGILYSVLNELIGNGAEYNKKIKFNYLPIWPKEGGAPDGSDNTINSKAVLPDFVDGASFMNEFANLYVSGSTPTTAAYVSAADEMFNSIKYACQKNYIIVLSDGETNNDGQGQDASDGNRVEQTTNRSVASPLRAVLGDNWIAPNDGAYHYRWDSGYNPSNSQFEIYKGKRYDGSGHGIAYFSRQLFGGGEADLKADTETDIEGNPFEGKQNIQTYAIGFGADVGADGSSSGQLAWQYLQQAGRVGLANNDPNKSGAFIATEKETLKDAFSKIFSAAVEDMELTMGTDIIQTSVAAPVNVSAGNLQTGSDADETYKTWVAALDVRTGNWSSTLSFSKFDSKKLEEEKDGKTYHPKYESERTIIIPSTGGFEKLTDSSTHAALFGYEDYQEEYAKAFFPWLSRKGGASLTADQDIEKAIEGLSPRKIAKYRDRIKGSSAKDEVKDDATSTSPTVSMGGDDEKAKMQRMMGDVIDSSPIAIQDTTVDLNDPEFSGNKKDELIDRARYLIMGSNDGMLYIFQRAEKDAATQTDKFAPYKFVLNYLPVDMPREKDYTLGKILPTTAETGYGKEYKKIKTETTDTVNAGTGQNEQNTTVEATGGLPHIYGVNGGLAYTTTATLPGRFQETLLLANMGQGGRGAFALKIGGNDATSATKKAVGIDAGNYTANVPMYQIKNGDAGVKIGYTVGIPVFAQLAYKWATPASAIVNPNDEANKDADKTRPSTKCSGEEYDTDLTRAVACANQNVRLVGFVANGYPTAGNENHDAAPTLYVFEALGYEIGNAKTGEDADKNAISLAKKTGDAAGKLIRAVQIGDATAGRDGVMALASPTPLDSDGDGIVDVVYAGDFAGSMYRFDLRYDDKDWKAYKIFSGDKTRPITSAPAVYRINGVSNLQYVVTFGTGSDIYPKDLSDEDGGGAKDVQRIYGIYDDLALAGKTKTDAELLERKLTVTEREHKFASGFNAGQEPAFRRVNAIEGCDFDGQKTQALNNPATTCPMGVKQGWYLELLPSRPSDVKPEDVGGDKEVIEYSSERVVTRPQLLLNSVFYTTRSYIVGDGEIDLSGIGKDNADKPETCNQEETVEGANVGIGTSWILGFNVLTGGTLDQARFQFMTEYDKDTGKSLNKAKAGMETIVGFELDAGMEVVEESADDHGGTTDKSGKDNNNKNIASALTIIDFSSNDSVLDAVDENGNIGNGLQQSLGGVYDATLNGSKPYSAISVKSNSCVKKNTYGAFTNLSSAGKAGVGLDANECAGAFVRTSLREIKMIE